MTLLLQQKFRYYSPSKQELLRQPFHWLRRQTVVIFVAIYIVVVTIEVCHNNNSGLLRLTKSFVATKSFSPCIQMFL